MEKLELRDIIAIQVLNGVIASHSHPQAQAPQFCNEDVRGSQVKYAYEMADLMIKERNINSIDKQ